MTEGIADFGAFYRRHAADVYRFALHLAGDPSEAEDITSETFARAWAASGRIDAATVRGYLFTIARNLHLQAARRRARHVPLDAALPEPRDPRADPGADAEARSEVDALRARLQRLPEVDRAALLMRAVDDMPYEEIARALGISPVSARVKVHRARLALAAMR